MIFYYGSKIFCKDMIKNEKMIPQSYKNTPKSYKSSLSPDFQYLYFPLSNRYNQRFLFLSAITLPFQNPITPCVSIVQSIFLRILCHVNSKVNNKSTTSNK